MPGNWTYNHSSVLKERSEMFKYAKMLMAEEDDKVCELIFKQQDNLILKINDIFPRIIIKKYRILQGKVVWLWILSFVIE